MGQRHRNWWQGAGELSPRMENREGIPKLTSRKTLPENRDCPVRDMHLPLRGYGCESIMQIIRASEWRYRCLDLLKMGRIITHTSQDGQKEKIVHDI